MGKKESEKMSAEKTRLETVEESMRKQVEEMVTHLFLEHQTAVGNKELTINKIEEIMLSARTKTEEILKEALPLMVKASEEDLIEKKKCARISAKS
jgi:hypothetical protein